MVKLTATDIYEMINNAHSRLNGMRLASKEHARAAARFIFQDIASRHLQGDTLAHSKIEERILECFPVATRW